MAAIDLAAQAARPQAPNDLNAQQLAAAFRFAAAVREFIESESEHITLIGPFAHRQRYAPRHVPRARFEFWRRGGVS
jgi:hypothetical protein